MSQQYCAVTKLELTSALSSGTGPSKVVSVGMSLRLLDAALTTQKQML